MIRKRRAFRITTGTTGSPTTTNAAGRTCFLAQLVIHVKNAGTAWTLAVLDKATAPRTWFGPLTLALPADGKPIIILFVQGGGDDPPLRGKLMEGGIDIVTAGTTPGEAAVDVDFATLP